MIRTLTATGWLAVRALALFQIAVQFLQIASKGLIGAKGFRFHVRSHARFWKGVTVPALPVQKSLQASMSARRFSMAWPRR